MNECSKAFLKGEASTARKKGEEQRQGCAEEGGGQEGGQGGQEQEEQEQGEAKAGAARGEVLHWTAAAKLFTPRGA